MAGAGAGVSGDAGAVQAGGRGAAAARDGELFNTMVTAAFAAIPYVGPQVAEFYVTYLAPSHKKRRDAILKVLKAPFTLGKCLLRCLGRRQTSQLGD